jgi:hypothetical protein
MVEMAAAMDSQIQEEARGALAAALIAAQPRG